MRTVFLRALEADDKAVALLAAIHAPNEGAADSRFELDVESFAAVPRSPFAYWTGERLPRLFKELPGFEAEERTAKVGVQTSDDARFVRAWWAVVPTNACQRWFPFTKGGGASAFYTDISLSLNWANDGHELKAFAETTPGTTHWSRKLPSTDFYFRPGFSWALRTARFAPSVVPARCIFSVSRYQAFAKEQVLVATVGLLSSSVCTALLRMSSERFGHPKFIIGIVQTLPVPRVSPPDEEALALLARRAWSLKRSLDTRTENSHAFVLPALLQLDGETLSERAAAWAERVRAMESELDAIQAEIDERCFDLYGIEEDDRRAITEGFGIGTGEDGEIDGDAEAEADEGEADSGADLAVLAAELASWAVGVAFGRFDVRLGTGEREFPGEPGPFDPLPVCSPGMMAGEDGLPLAKPPTGYPLDFPADGVLVDDPGHRRDLTTAARAVFELVFGEGADARWQEAAALVDPKNHDLRGWLAKRFFALHLKGYSKSRRKAPILWQLGTASGSYSVWLYAHRLTKDSLYRVLNDLVAPKLSLEERKQTALTQSAGPNPTASQRKEIAAQEVFVEELRVLKEELGRVAPLWNPDLNDGVVLTMAPLWRLVPQHKPWQRELKAAWKSLGEGKYDWAHLAMQLWPERVVPKCATDRSLAIAHGLEDSFWIENDDGKWKPRSEPARPIEELIGERTSAGVKAGLEGLEGATLK